MPNLCPYVAAYELVSHPCIFFPPRHLYISAPLLQQLTVFPAIIIDIYVTPHFSGDGLLNVEWRKEL